MRIIYEIGDYVDRIKYKDAVALRIKEITTTGVVVDAMEYFGSNKRTSNSNYSDFKGGKFLHFSEIKPSAESIKRTILEVGDTEIDMAVVYENEYLRIKPASDSNFETG